MSPSIKKLNVPAAERSDNSTRMFALALIPRYCNLSFKFSATSLAASPAFRSTDVEMPLLRAILIVWSVEVVAGMPPRLP